MMKEEIFGPLLPIITVGANPLGFTML
jgi:hypothetical protein